MLRDRTSQFVVAAMAACIIIGAFVFSISLLIWTALKLAIGIRVDEASERAGLDKVELGLEAYPEFSPN